MIQRSLLKKSLKRFQSINFKQEPLYRKIQIKLNNPDEYLCRIYDKEYNEETNLLERKPDSILCKYWWSETPFKNQNKLQLPIFSLKESKFQNKFIELDELLFNQPIRRDIIHTVHRWALNFGKIKTHKTKRVSEVAGSGKKPRPQKGTGQARMGNKRASGRKGGGKIWGPHIRDFTYVIPTKKKLIGLTATLSAKLAEGKICIIDSEKIDSYKTKDLKGLLPKLGNKELFLFVTPKNPDKNFCLASKNLRRYKVVDPNQINIIDLLKFDKLLFTVESLKELTNLLLAAKFMSFKPMIIKDQKIEEILNFNFSTEQPDQEKPVFDPEEGFEPKFQVLSDYYKEYSKLREEDKIDLYKDKPFE